MVASSDRSGLGEGEGPDRNDFNVCTYVLKFLCHSDVVI